jgi:hypothetical protein
MTNDPEPARSHIASGDAIPSRSGAMKTPRQSQTSGIPAQTEHHLPLTQAATAVARPSRKRKRPCNEPPSEPPETNVLDEKEPRTLVLDLLEPWRPLSVASSPEAQAPQKSKRRESLPSKRPKNQISILLQLRHNQRVRQSYRRRDASSTQTIQQFPQTPLAVSHPNQRKSRTS